MILSIKSFIKPRKIIIILAILPMLFYSFRNMWASEGRMRFEQALDLKVEVNGAFLRDSDGYLWFGASCALFRYDGYEVKKYTAGHNSLSGSWILSLAEDREGVIWIGTNGTGVTAYNKNNGVFTHYRHNPDDSNSLSSDALPYTNQTIFQDKSGMIWIGTQGGGLNRFDKKTDSFTHYRHDPNDENSLSSDKVNAIIEDKSGIIWIGTEDGGLNRFERETGTWTRYNHDPDDESSLSDDNVQSVIEDRNGIIWAGTKENGLNRFDRGKKIFARYANDPDNPDSIGDNNVFYIHEDRSGRIWLCHYYAKAGNPGLSMFDKTSGVFTSYAADPDTPQSLSGIAAGCVYDDPETGIFWVISTVGQVDKYDKNANKFSLWQHDSKDPNSLGDNGVTKVYEDSKGIIWIGTYAGGLNKFDKTTGTFFKYSADKSNPYSFPYTWITGILEDSSGRFWVGSQDVLTLFDTETGKVTKRYAYDADDSHSFTRCKAIRSIIEDRDDPNIIWIGTHGGGLVRLNKEQEKFTIYKHDPEDPYSLSYDVLRIVYDDGKGAIWIPTFKGLNRFDKKTKKFTRYFHDPDDPGSIHSDFLIEAYGDSSTGFWITGKGGISRFVEITGTFKTYTEKSGFPNGTLFIDIREDDKGNLWISSSSGLFKFNPGTKSVRVYTAEDGLQSNAFWGDSVWKTRDGQMWFGGANGVNSFYPEEVTDNPYIPPIILTSFKQGGEDVDLGMAPEKLRKIKLDWNANFFEFQFAAMNYTMPEKNRYAYMLEGVDNDWYYSGNNPFGRYSNLPGGTYTLRLKGSNNDGVWNEEGVAIKVNVIPPFYRTWWFFCLVGLGVVVLAGLFYTQRIRHLKREQLIEKEKAILANEMQLARRIQTSLLPDFSDWMHPDLEIAGTMLTADEVGGDFYDVSYDRSGNLWFVVGDVSDHGVTPGLIMMMAQTIYATVTASLDCEARDVVIQINEILFRNVHERMKEEHFMTFTALKYQGNGLFQHAGAHLSMIVFRKKAGICELIGTKGTYLNFKKDISGATINSEFVLDPGDILVLYTDGLTEAETPDRKMLDIDGFMNIVIKHVHMDPETMKESIMSDVLTWSENKRADDMTIVVVKRKEG